MTNIPEIQIKQSQHPRQQLTQADIHFAGDSGDGMQVLGMRFSESCAHEGNDIRTLPDFPAEIRAPQGTVAGVSGFQISFSSEKLYVPGDQFDVLVAMNPAALKAALTGLKKGGILIVDSDKFTKKEYEKAGFQSNPLETNELANYKVVAIALTSLTLKSLSECDISRSKARQCKNMYVLGIIYWLYEHTLEATKKWIVNKFQETPEIANANLIALRSGYNYALTTELFNQHYAISHANLLPGTYKQITGNQALVLGSLTVAEQNQKSLFMAGYPITPASDILHEMSHYAHMGVKVFQAEDEMAAAGSVLGAAFAGQLALTATSGPGMDLISETLGLAVMSELPMVVINVQRAGPSTGMPTKVEQSDLNQALYGRHGEAPMPVIAAKSPADCFDSIRLAFKIAVEFMTPVILMSDANIANGAEPWKIPDTNVLNDDALAIEYYTDKESFAPYKRNLDTLKRPWAIPGAKGLEHCIGGLEKQDITGNISYDPSNHEQMVKLREEKVARVAKILPPLEIVGPTTGETLIVGWGSVYGACKKAVLNLQTQGKQLSYVHLQSLLPFQPEFDELIRQFKNILVVELNRGQLCRVIRSTFCVNAQSIQKVQGKPFHVDELMSTFTEYL